eukprot:1110761-Prymnesium_polylepis.2
MGCDMPYRLRYALDSVASGLGARAALLGFAPAAWARLAITVVRLLRSRRGHGYFFFLLTRHQVADGRCCRQRRYR